MIVEVAAMFLHGQHESVPSSKGLAQPAKEVAGQEERQSLQSSDSGGLAQPAPFSEGPLLEPHPTLRHLNQSASLLQHLVPGGLTAFLAAAKSLGEHQGNLLLHSILAFAKYPTVVNDLAPRLANLPKHLKAQVDAPSTSAFRGCVFRIGSSTGSSSNQSHLSFTCTRFTCHVGLVQTCVRCAEIWFRLGFEHGQV